LELLIYSVNYTGNAEMNHHASLDEAFIRRLTEIVNEHIANEHFGAEELSWQQE
jgi:hypothetical protein